MRTRTFFMTLAAAWLGVCATARAGAVGEIHRVAHTPSAALRDAQLGVAGFSLGGFSALVSAGARIDLDHIIRFCRSHAADATRMPQAGAPDQTMAARERSPPLERSLPTIFDPPKETSAPGARLQTSTHRTLRVPVKRALRILRAVGAKPRETCGIAARIR